MQFTCAWLVPSLTELVVQARGSSLIEAATATANLSTTLTLSERHILNKNPYIRERRYRANRISCRYDEDRSPTAPETFLSSLSNSSLSSAKRSIAHHGKRPSSRLVEDGNSPLRHSLEGDL